jgi:DNA-binding NarL/FixJ family response regulator
VVGECSLQGALDRLSALRAAGEQVAVIISRESMRAMSGSELLARSRSTHPVAKILQVDYGDDLRKFDVIAQGMAAGNVEHYVTPPSNLRSAVLLELKGIVG